MITRDIFKLACKPSALNFDFMTIIYTASIELCFHDISNSINVFAIILPDLAIQ